MNSKNNITDEVKMSQEDINKLLIKMKNITVDIRYPMTESLNNENIDLEFLDTLTKPLLKLCNKLKFEYTKSQMIITSSPKTHKERSEEH